MNQTFDLTRFSRLFAKHTADHYKNYLMSFFVLIGALFIIMGFITYMDAGRLEVKDQIPFYAFVLMIAGSIFSSMMFADLGNKKKAIAMLTLPASHFEKYLVGWLYSFLIFQLLYIPSFYLVVITLQKVSALNGGPLETQQLDVFDWDSGVRVVYLFYAILNSICLLGSIYFLKNQFIKTAFTFFVCLILLFFLNTEIAQAVIDKKVIAAVPFNDVNVRLDEGKSFKSVNIRLPFDDNIPYIVALIASVLIAWAGSYYKLKEKEV